MVLEFGNGQWQRSGKSEASGVVESDQKVTQQGVSREVPHRLDRWRKLQAAKDAGASRDVIASAFKLEEKQKKQEDKPKPRKGQKEELITPQPLKRKAEETDGVQDVDSSTESVVKDKRSRTKTEEAAASAKPRKQKAPQTHKAPKAVVADEETTASERSAQESLEAGDFSLSALQRALDLMEVPINTTRTNVMPKGQTEIQGMLVGMFSFCFNFGITTATKQHPFLTKLLIAAMRVVDDKFPFTAIQLNKNYASRPHIDKHNLGCSYIVGLGDYEGGELWVHDDASHGEELITQTIDSDDHVSASYPAGSTISGRLEDCKNKWAMFDGNKLHCTQPFTGTRYSIIFFTSDQYKSAPAHVREELGAAGFDFDWDAEQLEQMWKEKMEKKQELVRARYLERVEKRIDAGRCSARVWAECWGLQCSATCAEGEDMCSTHIKGGRWETHGKFGGDMPEAKREEMKKWQTKLIRKGGRPPADEPWTELVDIPEEDGNHESEPKAASAQATKGKAKAKAKVKVKAKAKAEAEAASAPQPTLNQFFQRGTEMWLAKAKANVAAQFLVAAKAKGRPKKVSSSQDNKEKLSSFLKPVNGLTDYSVAMLSEEGDDIE